MEIKGKICIITGGTSGIGLQIVKKLLSCQLKHIILFELDNSNSRLVFNQLEDEYQERVAFYPCDVTDSEKLKENFDKAFANYKTIDILINNAGILNETTYERMIDINYKAVVVASLKMIDLVGKHKGGKGGLIVNVASIVGVWNILLPIYSSTKHAVVSFSRTLNQSINVTGIRVISVCPGMTDTPLLHAMHTGLDFVKGIDKIFAELQMQPPEHVAQAVAEIIQTDKDADVWVCEENQPSFAVKDEEPYKNLKIDF